MQKIKCIIIMSSFFLSSIPAKAYSFWGSSSSSTTKTVSTPSGPKTVSVSSSSSTKTFSASATSSGKTGVSASGSGMTKQVSTPSGMKTVSVSSGGSTKTFSASASSSAKTGVSASGSGMTKQVSTPSGMKTVSVSTSDSGNDSDSTYKPFTTSAAKKTDVTSGYAEYYKSKTDAAALAKETGFNEKDYYSPSVVVDLYAHALTSYKKAGIPLDSTIYSKGPTEQFAIKAGASEKDKLAASSIDIILYQASIAGADVSISLPTSKYYDISKVGQEMTPVQLLGVKNSIVISAPKQLLVLAEAVIDKSNGLDPDGGLFKNDPSTTALTIDANKLQQNGQMLSGYLLLDTAVTKEVYLDGLKHESHHGGINVMLTAAKYSPTGIGVVDEETKRLLSSIKGTGQIAELFNGGTKEDVQVGSILLQGRPSFTQSDYINSKNEFLAFSSSGALGLNELANQFSLVNNISLSEAKIAVATMMDSPTLQDLNDDLNENAELVMKNIGKIAENIQAKCAASGCGN